MALEDQLSICGKRPRISTIINARAVCSPSPYVCVWPCVSLYRVECVWPRCVIVATSKSSSSQPQQKLKGKRRVRVLPLVYTTADSTYQQPLSTLLSAMYSSKSVIKKSIHIYIQTSTNVYIVLTCHRRCIKHTHTNTHSNPITNISLTRNVFSLRALLNTHNDFPSFPSRQNFPLIQLVSGKACVHVICGCLVVSGNVSSA